MKKLKVHGVLNNYITNPTLRRSAPHIKSFSRYAPSAFYMLVFEVSVNNSERV